MGSVVVSCNLNRTSPPLYLPSCSNVKAKAPLCDSSTPFQACFLPCSSSSFSCQSCELDCCSCFFGCFSASGLGLTPHGSSSTPIRSSGASTIPSMACANCSGEVSSASSRPPLICCNSHVSVFKSMAFPSICLLSSSVSPSAAVPPSGNPMASSLSRAVGSVQCSSSSS